MEPRWVLTSSQKKVRFRALLKKRKSGKEREEKPQVNTSEELEPMSEENNADESPISGSPNSLSSLPPLSDQNSVSPPVHNIQTPLNRELNRKRSMEGNEYIILSKGI